MTLQTISIQYTIVKESGEATSDISIIDFLLGNSIKEELASFKEFMSNYLDESDELIINCWQKELGYRIN